jgi:hypothetical protein
MDEQGWQIARIAPLRPEDDYEDNDGLPWPAGKIVRVRLARPVVYCGQGHPGFEIHPEDDWGNGCMLICEDQFWTD